MYIPSTSTARKAFICVAVWTMPLITSLIPTIAGEMKPVGGNWCWISATRPDLRYGMTHGWRFFVIFSTIIIYIYIWIYLRKHLGTKSRSSGRTLSFSTRNTNTMFSKGSKDTGFRVMKEDEVELDTFRTRRGEVDALSSPTIFEQGLDWDRRREKRDEIEDMGVREGENEVDIRTMGGRIHHQPSSSRRSEVKYSAVTNPNPQAPPQAQQNMLQTNASEFPQRRATGDVEVEIKRMMLLNGYPFMYVLLWTPGLVNRLLEALGTPVSETTIAALNMSTQFIGFANAATYGFNHHLRDRLGALVWTPAVMRMRRRFGR